jgi:putative protease
LAPAGRPEALIAALEAGADAVYVGTRDFNARLRAPNFEIDELARLTRYAHGLGRKVYVTCNTLVQEAELPRLVQTLDALRRIGPDALIIQDLGVYRLARRLAPEIPLHASTQMTIHSLDGALEAQRLGFERAILARELTLDEIRAIRAGCSIELETFVHGALCYSISGQCLFSSALHGASANRGRCMQPCRRLFEMGKGAADAAFSMLDLAAAPILPQLIAAGIRCFKIEGRLKPAETIAQIVGAYRLLLDAHPYITHEVVAEARERLDRAIGRESSTGFYQSAQPERILGSGDEAQSGRRLGETLADHAGWFGIEPNDTIKKGDRLRVQVSARQAPRAFIVREIRRDGKPVNRAYATQHVTIAAPFPVPAGATLVKAADADATPRGAVRRIERLRTEALAGRPAKAALEAHLALAGDGALTLEVRVGGEKVALSLPSLPEGTVDPMPLARSLAILGEESDSADVRLAVKWGEARCAPKAGTALVIPTLPEGLLVEPSAVAGLREKALQRVMRLLARQRDDLRAEVAREESRTGILPVPHDAETETEWDRQESRTGVSPVSRDAEMEPQRQTERERDRQDAYPTFTIVRLDALAQAETVWPVLEPGAGGPKREATSTASTTSIVLPLAEVEEKGFRAFLERPGMRASLILALPTFLFDPERRALVQGHLRRALDAGVRRFEVTNLGHFHLLRATGRRGLWLLVGPAIGCLNSECHAQLRDLGADVVTYSIEGGRANLERLAARIDPERLAVRLYGPVPLFQSRVAGPKKKGPAQRLREPQFDLRLERRDGITYVLAAETQNLATEWPRLTQLGLHVRVFDLTFDEHPEDAPVLHRGRRARPAAAAAEPLAAGRFRHFRNEIE